MVGVIRRTNVSRLRHVGEGRGDFCVSIRFMLPLSAFHLSHSRWFQMASGSPVDIDFEGACSDLKTV